MQAVDTHDLQCLEQRIQSLLGSRVLHLVLEVHGEGVILRGRARTFHAKQLAQHAVMTMGEFALIANEIEVI